MLAALAAGLGLAAFTALWLGHPGAIMATGRGVIAPSTAVLVLALGLTLCLHQWGLTGSRTRRGWARGLAAMQFSLLAAVGLRPGWLAAVLERGEHALVSETARAAGLTDPQMAPITALVLALVAGLLLAATFSSVHASRGRHAALAASLILMLTQVATLLGWGAGLPLVFGTTTIPMSPGAAIAVLMLGAALALNFGLLPWLRRVLFAEEEGATLSIPVLEQRRRNLILLGLILLSGAVVAGCVFYLHTQLIANEREILGKLTNIAELKRGQIEGWQGERMADGRVLQGSALLRRPLPDLAAGLPDDLDHYLENFRATYNYRHLALFDRMGRLRLATPAGAEADIPLTPEVVAGMAGTNAVRVEDLKQSPGGVAVLDLLVPLFTAAGDFNGIARLQVDARRDLLPMVQRWTDPSSRTGEAMLLRREGMEIVALSELRHEADSALRARRPLASGQLLAGQAILQETPGLLHGRDYRGVAALGVARAIRDRGWLLMVKIDREEALAPVRAEAAQILLLLVTLGGIVGLGLSKVWRQRLTTLKASKQLAEAERQAALARLGLVMDHANDVILISNREGRILEANARVRAFYGYTPEEMHALHASDLQDPAGADTAAADYALAQRPEGHLFETRHRRKDGTSFPVEINARLVTIDQQEFVLSVLRDISERQKLAAESARREAQLRFIFEHVPVGLSFRDENGQLIVNAEHERITGVPAAESNRPGVFAAASHPEDYARQLAAAARFEKGETDNFSIEKRYVHPDGKTTWVQLSSHWLGDPQSGRREALTTIVDITAHKRREQEIERANRLYQLVSQINQTLLRVESREQMLADVCRVLTETGNYQAAWVAWHDPSTRRFEPVALAGVSPEEAAALRLSSDPAVPGGQSPSGVAFRENRTVVCNDITTNPLTARWSEIAAGHGIRSVVTLPIRQGQVPVAVLIVYAGSKDTFQYQDIGLLEEAAGDISFALNVLAGNEDRLRATEALRAHEQHLQTLLNSTPAMIYSLRAADDHRFTFISPNVLTQLGHAPEEFTRDPGFWAAQFHPDDVAANAAAVRDLATAPVISREYRARHRDGTWRWLHDEMRLVRDAAGQPREVVGYLLDITERRQAEDALQAREQIFASMIGQAVDAIALVDAASGRFVEFNRSAHETLGYTREEFADLTLAAIQADHDPATIRRNIEQIQLNGWAAFETRHRHRDGTLREVRVSARAITVRGHEYLTAVWSDIGEQKLLQAELKQQQGMLQAIFDHAPVGISFTKQDRLLMANAAHDRLTGIAFTPGIDPQVFKRATHPDDLAGQLQDSAAFMRGETDQFSCEKRYLHPDGKATWVRFSVRRFIDAGTGEVQNITTLTDISELKRLENEVAENSARLRFIFEHAPVGIAFAVSDGKAILVNPEHERITGVTAADSALPGVFARASHPDDYARQMQAAEAFVQGKVDAYSFDKRYVHPDGKTVWARLSSRWFIDPTTGAKHAVTIISDITEQKVAELALREREELLSTILEQAVDSIILYDLVDDRFAEFNRAAHESLGYTREEFAQLTIRDIDVGLDQDTIAAALGRMLAPEGAVAESKHRRKDGAIRDVRISGRKVTIRGRDYLATLISDVTESRRLLETLRQSEERHRSLFENMELGVVYQDAAGRITAANRAAERILGLSLDQMQGRTSVDPGWRAIREDGSAFPGDEHPAMVALRTGQRVHEVIMGIQTDALPMPRWLQVDAVPEFRAGEPRPFRVFAVFNDITARRAAESEVRKLSLALAQSPIAVVITDLQGNIEYVNPRFEEVTGYTAAEARGRNPRILKSGLTDPAVFTDLWQTINAGQPWRGELINRRKDGTVFTELVLITSVKNAAGQPQLFVALKEDITERKAIEDALRVNEATLETTGRMAQIGGWRLDLGERRLDWTRETKRLHGVPLDYVPELDRALDFYAPEYRDAVRQAVTACADRGEPFDLEARLITADDRSRWVRIRGEAATVGGRIVALQGAIQDITERRAAEENVRKLSRIVAQAPLSIAITNLEGAIEYVNPRFSEVTGYTFAEVQGQNPRVLKSGRTPATVYQAMWETLTAGGTWRGELENRKKNGDLYTEHAVIAPVTDDSGRTTHYVAIKEDITARKRTEQALIRSEELYRLIAENTSDAIWIYDLGKTQFTFLSPAAARLSGRAVEEMVGQDLECILTPEACATARRVIADRMAAYRGGDRSARTQIGIYDHRHRDGRIIRGEVVSTLLTDATGRIGQLLGVSRDVTEREKAAEELRQSLQRLRKAEEIAHVGNWELDHATDDLIWSDEVYRIFEQDPATFRPNLATFREMLHADDRARVSRAFSHAIEEHRRYLITHRIVLPGGRIKHLEESAETTYDRRGQPVRSIGTVQDVTERKQVEFELHGLVRELRTYAAVARTLEDRTIEPRAQLTAVAGHVVASLPPENHPHVEISVDRMHVHAGSRGERLAERSVPITVNGRVAGRLTLSLIAKARPGTGSRQEPAPRLPQSELLESVARAVGLALGERESYAQMERSEERFRAIFDQAEVGMFETTPEGTITRANPFLGRLLGREATALVGRPWREVITAESPARRQDPPPEAAELIACQRADGTTFRGQVSGKLERGDEGGRRGYICLLQDVTAQVEARETLERFNSELEAQVARRTAELDARNREVQALLQSIPDRVMRLRIDGTVLYYQAARQPAAGSSPAAAEPPSGLVAAALDLGRLVAGGAGSTTAEIELKLDGHATALELRAAPVGHDEFVVFVRDITARKRLEAETVAMLEKERQVSEMKTRFISVTSHEFRTPMSAAMGSVELLANHLDRLTPAKRLELLDRITTSLRRMTGMLDDVLTLNRIEGKRVEAKPVALDFRTHLEGIVEEIRIGNSRGHRFRIEGPDRLPLVSDPNLLHHIFGNLLSNAVRYSPERSEVTVRIEAGGGRLRVAVEDQGIGVPATDRARIFEAFERGSNVGQIKGTGLGLNIVKRMVELLGGSIHLESPETGGSRFLVDLPSPVVPDPSP